MSDRPFNKFREKFGLDRQGPLVLAHRGDSFYAPENTLIAASLGHRSGAVGWEFDVRLSRDGVPVVMHDPGLGRTTDVAQRLRDDPRADLAFLMSEFALDEIQRLDAGAWFVRPEGGSRTARDFGTFDRLDAPVKEAIASGSVRVPTLEEAIAITIDLDWLANIEIKSDHDGDFGLVDAVLDVIDRLDAAERVLISSFDHAEVARVVLKAPKIATGVLSSTPLYRPASYVREVVGADAYHVSAASLGADGVNYLRRRSATGLRTGDIDACRSLNVPVLVYTVNDSGPIKRAGHLAEAGVAGVFSDDPRSFYDPFTPFLEHTRSHREIVGHHSAGL